MLAQQIAKHRYVFNFLGLSEEGAGREFEQVMPDRTTQTLAGLGGGFSFVDRQQSRECIWLSALERRRVG